VAIEGGAAEAMFVSTNPAAGQWSESVFHESSSFTGLACASATLCVATGAGSLFTSTNPAGGASTWKLENAPTRFKQITCGSPSFCVGIGELGELWISTEPAAGAKGWRNGFYPGGGGFGQLNQGHYRVKGAAVYLPMTCTGLELNVCAGSVELVVVEKKGKKPVIVTVGKPVKFHLIVGTHTTLKIGLTHTGRRFLARKHRSLKALLKSNTIQLSLQVTP
jgi:hypothetical protein